MKAFEVRFAMLFVALVLSGCTQIAAMLPEEKYVPPRLPLQVTPTFAPTAEKGQEPTGKVAEAPKYLPGDWWEWGYKDDFRNLTWVFQKEEQAESGRELLFQSWYGMRYRTVATSPGLGILFVANNEMAEEAIFNTKDPLFPLPFPLFVGKEMERTFLFPLPGAQKPAWLTMRTWVSGIDRVETPAGTFEAFRIQHRGTRTVGNHLGKALFERIEWYSPEVMGVVKTLSGEKTDRTLIRYGLQKR